MMFYWIALNVSKPNCQIFIPKKVPKTPVMNRKILVKAVKATRVTRIAP